MPPCISNVDLVYNTPRMGCAKHQEIPGFCLKGIWIGLISSIGSVSCLRLGPQTNSGGRKNTAERKRGFGGESEIRHIIFKRYHFGVEGFRLDARLYGRITLLLHYHTDCCAIGLDYRTLWALLNVSFLSSGVAGVLIHSALPIHLTMLSR